MATFSTSAKQAREAGFTHLRAANGTTIRLDQIGPRCKPGKYKMYGWVFGRFLDGSCCLIYLEKPGAKPNFCELLKG